MEEKLNQLKELIGQAAVHSDVEDSINSLWKNYDTLLIEVKDDKKKNEKKFDDLEKKIAECEERLNKKEKENTITPIPELSKWVTEGGQEEDWLDKQESEDISHLMPELTESIRKTLARKHGSDPFDKYVVE